MKHYYDPNNFYHTFQGHSSAEKATEAALKGDGDNVRASIEEYQRSRYQREYRPPPISGEMGGVVLALTGFNQGGYKLKKYKSIIPIKNKEGRDLVMIAAGHCDPETVRWLLNVRDGGGTLQTKDLKSNNPLMYAVSCDNYATVEWLSIVECYKLQYNKAWKATSPIQRTRQKYYALPDYRTQFNSFINYTRSWYSYTRSWYRKNTANINDNCLNLLYCAAKDRKLNAFLALLRAGASLDSNFFHFLAGIKNPELIYDIIKIALREVSLEEIVALVGQDFNNGWRSALYAYSKGNINVAKLLTRGGVRQISKKIPLEDILNSITEDGLRRTKSNEQFDAVKRGDISVIKRKIKENDETINCVDENGNTLLHCAVLLKLEKLLSLHDRFAGLQTEFGKEDLIRYLVNCGVDVNAKNKEGFTVMDLLEKESNQNLYASLCHHAYNKDEKREFEELEKLLFSDTNDPDSRFVNQTITDLKCNKDFRSKALNDFRENSPQAASARVDKLFSLNVPLNKSTAKLEAFYRVLESMLSDIYIKSMAIERGLAVASTGKLGKLATLLSYGTGVASIFGPLASVIVSLFSTTISTGIQFRVYQKANRFNKVLAGNMHEIGDLLQEICIRFVERYQNYILNLSEKSVEVFAAAAIRRMFDFIYTLKITKQELYDGVRKGLLGFGQGFKIYERLSDGNTEYGFTIIQNHMDEENPTDREIVETFISTNEDLMARIKRVLDRIPDSMRIQRLAETLVVACSTVSDNYSSTRRRMMAKFPLFNGKFNVKIKFTNGTVLTMDQICNETDIIKIERNLSALSASSTSTNTQIFVNRSTKTGSKDFGPIVVIDPEEPKFRLFNSPSVYKGSFEFHIFRTTDASRSELITLVKDLLHELIESHKQLIHEQERNRSAFMFFQSAGVSSESIRHYLTNRCQIL